jgi:clan AA aspartic protease (TIGR02281 family)
MVGWAMRCLAVVVVLAALAGALPADFSGESLHSWLGAGDSEGAARPTAEARHAAVLEQVIEAGDHGHFLVDALVNGRPITFLVDTGASHVVLNAMDAGRIGLGNGRLRYSHRFSSANGTVRAAPVTLRELRIGQLQLHDLDAFVNEGPLDISLLCMSFLHRLEGYEVRRGRLLLRW